MRVLVLLCVDRHIARKNPTKGKSQRVLDIKPGSLCFVIGTVYMEMRLKPNILEELSREVGTVHKMRDLPILTDPLASNISQYLDLGRSSCLTTMKSCWKTSLVESA